MDDLLALEELLGRHELFRPELLDNTTMDDPVLVDVDTAFNRDTFADVEAEFRRRLGRHELFRPELLDNTTMDDPVLVDVDTAFNRDTFAEAEAEFRRRQSLSFCIAQSSRASALPSLPSDILMKITDLALDLHAHHARARLNVLNLHLEAMNEETAWLAISVATNIEAPLVLQLGIVDAVDRRPSSIFLRRGLDKIDEACGVATASAIKGVAIFRIELRANATAYWRSVFSNGGCKLLIQPHDVATRQALPGLRCAAQVTGLPDRFKSPFETLEPSLERAEAHRAWIRRGLTSRAYSDLFSPEMPGRAEWDDPPIPPVYRSLSTYDDLRDRVKQEDLRNRVKQATSRARDDARPCAGLDSLDYKYATTMDKDGCPYEPDASLIYRGFTLPAEIEPG